MLEVYYVDTKGCKNVEEVLLNRKREIHERLIDCVDIGFNHDIQSMEAFIIEDPETGQDYIFAIDRSNWNEVLDNSLDYFLDIEDYDKCSHIRDLKDRINTDFSKHPEID